MNATPSNFSNPAGSGAGVLPTSGRANFGRASASSMSMKWSALHDAASVVATLAGLGTESMQPEVRNFPAVMRDAGGWRHHMAELGVEDMSAIMEPGLAALLSVHARGADPAPPALALWQEFHAARSALMALVPPAASQTPRRIA